MIQNVTNVFSNAFSIVFSNCLKCFYKKFVSTCLNINRLWDINLRANEKDRLWATIRFFFQASMFTQGSLLSIDAAHSIHSKGHLERQQTVVDEGETTPMGIVGVFQSNALEKVS